MRRNIYTLSLFAAAFLVSVDAFAADSTATSGISWSGLVDVYYSQNFNNPSDQMNQMRNFDVYENQFGLSLAKVTLQKQASPVGFRIDMAFGTTNDIVQGIAPFGTNSYSTLSNVEQAYLTFVLPVGRGLTIDAGKFVTHMGYEVIESNANWNYSRSFLFAYAIPYYHAGMRITYPFSDKFSATLDILNGWNEVVDNNKSKTVGFTLNYAPGPSTQILLNGISGFEQTTIGAPGPVPYGKKNVLDLVATQQFGDDFAMALNADYGEERVFGFLNTWKGVALYGKYTLTGKSDLAIRGEVYYDPNDYTTGASFPKATFKEVTVTYEYDLFANLILRGEFREDIANGPMFMSSDGTLSKTSQPTLLIGAVATF
ncbi:MAG: porin [Bacteroidetes bacterium]|nr:porin [Bacteroidota bacterium]